MGENDEIELRREARRIADRRLGGGSTRPRRRKCSERAVRCNERPVFSNTFDEPPPRGAVSYGSFSTVDEKRWRLSAPSGA